MSTALPRRTKLGDKQLELLGPALVKALSDEKVQPAWEDALDAFWPLKDAWDAERLPSDAEMASAASKLGPLVETVRETAPDVDHFFGVYLAEWLQFFLLGHLGIDLPEDFKPKRHARFLPDNPLTRTKDGTVKEYQNATMRHFQQLRDYQRSLQPPKQRGRRPGTKRPKAPGRGGIDSEKAQRACEMDQHGKHWREIATTLLPEIDVYVDGDIAYQRVRRLIERGRILSEKARRIN